MVSRSDVYVAVPPRITRGPVSRSDVEGSSVTLQCRVVAAPFPDTVISWNKDGNLLDVREKSTVSQCTLVVEMQMSTVLFLVMTVFKLASNHTDRHNSSLDT